MLKSTSFIFDGQSSDDYNIMIYFVNDDSQIREYDFGTDVNILEERLNNKYSPIHYGTNINSPMKFPLTFGSVNHMSEFEVDAILSWLTGHNTYKWLEFIHNDNYIRYKCFLNDVKTVYINGLATAFKCEVVCDSQFGYEFPITKEYIAIPTIDNFKFYNRSSYNGYLYPTLELVLDEDCSEVSIVNKSDNNREFKMNYFDRIVTSEERISYTHTTNLFTMDSQNQKQSEQYFFQPIPSENITDILLEYNIHWNDYIVSGNNIAILPKDNNKVLLSFDNGITWRVSVLPEDGSYKGVWIPRFKIGNEVLDYLMVIDISKPTQTTYMTTNGNQWIHSTEITSLPEKIKWKDICIVAGNIVEEQYLFVLGEGGVGAISTRGFGWKSILMPSDDYKSIKVVNNKIVCLSDSGNKIGVSEVMGDWFEVTLPECQKWNDICFIDNGLNKGKYIMIADTLNTNHQTPICLISDDCLDWSVKEMPINNWRKVDFVNGKIIAASEKHYAVSNLDDKWQINKLPTHTKYCILFGGVFGVIDDKSIYMLQTTNVARGYFDIQILEEKNVMDMRIYAELNGLPSPAPSYLPEGKVLLFSNGNTLDEKQIAKDKRIGFDTALENTQATLQADWIEENKTIEVFYSFDPTHSELATAKLNIIAEYKVLVKTDLGFDNLILNFDNNNQIISSNRNNFNAYKYFNMNFFRLIKGVNDIEVKTNKGKCKIKLTCEFLRKVGGN